MLPHLQPHRPKVAQPNQGINHNQVRYPTTTSSGVQFGEGSRPRNQVEAMPPSGPPFLNRTMQPVFNSATCHPVFFTQTLVKPPFPIPHGPGVAGVNPAAFGYIAEMAKKNGMGTKL